MPLCLRPCGGIGNNYKRRSCGGNNVAACEQQAADIIRFLDPKEVQQLGAAMAGVADLSQEAVNIVLDDFVSTIKKQTNLGLGQPIM